MPYSDWTLVIKKVNSDGKSELKFELQFEFVIRYRGLDTADYTLVA